MFSLILKKTRQRSPYTVCFPPCSCSGCGECAVCMEVSGSSRECCRGVVCRVPPSFNQAPTALHCGPLLHCTALWPTTALHYRRLNFFRPGTLDPCRPAVHHTALPVSCHPPIRARPSPSPPPPTSPPPTSPCTIKGAGGHGGIGGVLHGTPSRCTWCRPYYGTEPRVAALGHQLLHPG